jgi:aspartyl aminopeptidase
VQALIDSTAKDDSLDNEAAVRSVALFDHEEVGSSSAVGAGGPLMRDAIVRLSQAFAAGKSDATERCLQKSFLVSADMAHGLHPNYADRHEPDHQPKFHKCAFLPPSGGTAPRFSHACLQPRDVRVGIHVQKSQISIVMSCRIIRCLLA